MRGAARSAAEPATGPVGEAEFAALMAPLGPFGPAPRLVAGVSGGPHSLALALLAAAWARRRGGGIAAIVCDHGLRAESGAESAAVAAMLDARGIAVRVRRLGLARGPAVQARARAARLAALLEACAEHGAPWLLLGHQRADQAETVLLRALSGSGATGLAAMAPARAEAAALVLRPLLGLAPARLEAVVAAAGLSPIRDPSNHDARFDRVRLRDALADPGGEGPAVQALSEAAARFAARRGAAAAGAAARLAAAATLHAEGFARLDLVALGQDRVATGLLGALVRLVGGRVFAPSGDALARLLARGEGSLGGAVLRRDGLLLREAASLAAPVPALPGAGWDGRFRLVGGAPEGALEGALIGPAGEAARALPRPAWLPGAVVPTLPALLREGKLAAVPALAYRVGECTLSCAFRFVPAGGAAT